MHPAFADDDALAAYFAGDYKNAMKIWKPLADHGNADAQFYLGVLYELGQGVDKDPARAVAWYRKAAVKGHVEAQYNLANAYKAGRGVEEDDSQAVRWWKLAAESGYSKAQYNLGSMYYYGHGVTKDPSLARFWYQKAADQGDSAAKSILARLDAVQASPVKSTADGGQSSDSEASSNEPKAAAAPETPPSANPPAPEAPRAPVKPAIAGGDIVTREWVLQQDPESYTIQLYSSINKADAITFMNAHPVPEAAAFYRAVLKGKPIFRVVTGSYASLLDAQEAKQKLGEDIAKWAPWIRKMNTVQQEVRADPGQDSALAKQAAPKEKAPTKREEPKATAKTASEESAVGDADPERFTLQIYAARDRAAVIAWLKEHGLSSDTLVYPYQHDGQTWYRALYGDYASLAEAHEAERRLPEAIRKLKPWARKFATIQGELGRDAAASTEQESKAKEQTPPRKEASPELERESEPPASNGAPRSSVAQPASPPEPRIPPEQIKQALRAGQTSFMIGDYASAYRMWRPLAEDGVKEAQYNVGFMYESGWGVQKNFEEAVSWYRAAAEQGEFRAQFNLGLLYLSGNGIEKNQNQGMYWINRAAQLGHLRAQEFLANAYSDGVHGLPRDPDKAVYWAKKAGLE